MMPSPKIEGFYPRRRTASRLGALTAVVAALGAMSVIASVVLAPYVAAAILLVVQ